MSDDGNDGQQAVLVAVLEPPSEPAEFMPPHDPPPARSPGAERDPRTKKKITPDCNGAPGLCPFFRCRYNLVIDFDKCRSCKGTGQRSGKYDIYTPHLAWIASEAKIGPCRFCKGSGLSGTFSVTDPDGEFTTLPPEKSNDHTIGPADVEEAAERAIRVAEWLEETFGTTCAWDLCGQERTQEEVSRMFRLTRQRIQQVEDGAKRNAMFKALAKQSAEHQSHRGETVYPAPIEKHSPRAPLVQIRRKERT